MYKTLIVTIICLLTIISISHAGVSISPVNVNVNVVSNRIHIQTISISPVYVRPVSISGVNISTSTSAYNPSFMINRVNISTSISTINNRASQINRVYINHYNPYQLLKHSYQNIRVSYYNSNTNEFSTH